MRMLRSLIGLTLLAAVAVVSAPAGAVDTVSSASIVEATVLDAPDAVVGVTVSAVIQAAAVSIAEPVPVIVPQAFPFPIRLADDWRHAVGTYRLIDPHIAARRS